MSAIVKGQLLKYLSKFVKNLSSEHLSLKLLQGAGDIENIELNEALLSTTLGFPPWLQLRRVSCNRLSVRLHWTKLTSEPITIVLDVVTVDIEASPGSSPASQTSASSNSQSNPLRMPYGFVMKCIDGMSLTINSVEVHLRAASASFFAKLAISNVAFASTLPDFKNEVGHLKFTRLKSTQLKQVLLFKKAFCQSIRLEAGDANASMTPFRIIMSRLDAKITYKRSLIDSAVLFSRSDATIEHVLSVLTDTQAQVGLRFATYLHHLSSTSVGVAAQKAAVARNAATSNILAKIAPGTQTAASLQPSGSISKAQFAFNAKDLHEHSTRIVLANVDIHLVAERASQVAGSEDRLLLHPVLLEGAVRLSLENITFNLYPAHIIGAQRRDWPNYKPLLPSGDLQSKVGTSGYFEACVYGSIDGVKMYQATLPQEHNPNQLCLGVRGSGNFPAVCFDSRQLIQESDLSLIDTRNALRVSGVTITVHWPTILYLLMMARDASHLAMSGASQFEASGGSDGTSSLKSIRSQVRLDVRDIDIIYKRKPAVHNEDGGCSCHSNAGRKYSVLERTFELHPAPPALCISVAKFYAELSVDQARSTADPIFQQISSFVESFRLSTKPQADGCCDTCCSNLLDGHTGIVHASTQGIYVRWVNPSGVGGGGESPMAYLGAVEGYLPIPDGSANTIGILLRCNTSFQLFSDRDQLFELQELMTVVADFGEQVKKNMTALPLPAGAAAEQACHLHFLLPAIAVSIVLPATSPIILAELVEASSQVDESDWDSSEVSCDLVTIVSNSSGIGSSLKAAIPMSTSSPSEVNVSNSAAGASNLVPSTPLLDQSAPPEPIRHFPLELSSGLSASQLSITTTHSNVTTASSSSSSSGGDGSDFVVYAKEDASGHLNSETASMIEPQLTPELSTPCPLDDGQLDLGRFNGAAEVVEIKLGLEGAIISATIDPKASTDLNLQLYFSVLKPLERPCVTSRRRVFSSKAVLFDNPSPHLLTCPIERPFKIDIQTNLPSAAGGPPRLGLDIFVPSNIPPISLMALNALGYFIEDKFGADGMPLPPQQPPIIIKVHTADRSNLMILMDTQPVFERFPGLSSPNGSDIQMQQELSRPPMSISLGCPLQVHLDGNDLNLGSLSSAVAGDRSRHENSELRQEIERLRAENAQLKQFLHGGHS